MQNFKKNILPLLIIGVFVFMPFFSADAQLVPCGRGSETGNACTLCHLVQGAWNIIEFLKNIIIIVGITIITVAGIMYMVSAGNQGMISMAKAAIKNTLIGVSVMLLAFMIVTFIINNIFKNTSADLNTSTGGMSIGDTWSFNGNCD